MANRYLGIASIGLLALLSGCGGGGGGGGTPSPPPVDTTPNAFTFGNKTDAALSSSVTSAPITVAGINAATTISITGGEYSIDGGAFTSTAGTVNNNQSITVRVSCSGQFSTASNAVLTIGGVSATFTATTLAADTTPDAFSFARKADATRDTWVTSDSVTIKGINTTTPVSVENGEYAVAGGAFTSTAGTLEHDQALVVRVKSSTIYSKSARVRVTVGSVAVDFEATTEPGSGAPTAVETDGSVAWLLDRANKLVYRWSIDSGRYLDPYVLDTTQGAPADLAYSPAYKRLYVGYASGAVHYIDVTAVPFAESAFTTMSAGVFSLGDAGNFMVIQTTAGYGSGYRFDKNGTNLGTGGYYYGYSRETAWDPNSSRLYYFRDGLSPNDLQFDVIDQATGAVSSAGETPYHGSYNVFGPIRVTANGQYVLLGSGDIYNGDQLTWANSLGAQITDARWFSNGSLVALTTANNKTTLRRLGANNFAGLEQLTYDGQALRVIGTDQKMAVLVLSNTNKPRFYTYVPNDDNDNDGVKNTDDAFPLDPAASVDSDHDGYPDAWNAGRSAADSTTGLSLDAFPQDAACWLSTHANAGGTCDFSATMPAFVPDQVEQQGGVVYLLSIANKRVYRWSMTTQLYLNPFVVGSTQGFTTTAPTRMAVSAAHQRLYLGYDNGAIRYIDLASGNPAEVAFANAALGIHGLASVGNYVLAQDYSGAWATHYVFSAAGAITDQKEWNYYSREYAWDPVSSRVYFFRDDTSPDDLQYEVIDQATGKITSAGETPYHGDFDMQTPIRVSPDGEQVLLGTGDIYTRATLERTATLNAAITDARWFANGSLVTVITDGGHSVLRRLSANGPAVLEQLRYDGQALRVVGSDTRMALLFNVNGKPLFRIYLPSDDSDGDGVANTQDAFPSDPAASVDTDHDGYPDAWNPGKGPADSTSELDLDAFPQDSACWEASHGVGGVCDTSATVPSYIPDAVAQQGDVVYLLSKDNARVYRWSISGGKYLDPYVVGFNDGLVTHAPTIMTSTPQRLYFGYETGAIRYITLATGSPVEAPFATIAMSVWGLGSAGNFVIAQDQASPWGKRYVFDGAGAKVFEENSYIYEWYEPAEFIWDPVHSRAFTASPYYLRYDDVDPVTGQITGSGASAYTGNYNVSPPIRASVNGRFVLVGNGDVFDQSSNLSWAGSLGPNIADAHWFANGGVAVLSDTGTVSQLRRLAPSGQAVVERLTYAGAPLRVVGSDTALVVLTIVNGGVQFHNYVPNDDSDGDGVPNAQDAFPLDPAASVDTDHDGYPDAWNAGKTQADSTTGLTLDAYPLDMACWLPAHGNGTTCNYSAAMPDYVPDQVAQRGDVVYLLSAGNRRVYRWSIATGQYLSPWAVGLDLGYTTLAPVSIAYHPAQQRLYLGYSSGAIRYIDLNASTPSEVAFANTASLQPVTNLVPVNNLLFVNAGDGYLYTAGGVVTDMSNYWSQGETVWDPVYSRLYTAHAGGGYGLEFREIDATAGTFGDQYSRSSVIVPPLRVSPDGELILAGTGALFAQDGVAGYVGALGKYVTDAQWVGNLLVDVDDSDLVEIRSASSHAVLQSYQYLGQPLRVLFGTSEAYLMHVANDTTSFIRLPFYDQDGDQIPRWYEQRYNLDDSNAADATADPDGDGVNNRAEYQHLSNPRVADTDGDGLSDGAEINTWATDPGNPDSDGDGLNDQAEVVTWHSDPWDKDSDGDGYDDFIEARYGGNPTDVSVLPTPLSNYSQTFEGTPNLAAWLPGIGSNAPWAVDTTTAATGTASLKSGTVGRNEMSSVRFKGLFKPGQLSFNVRVDSNYTCCDQVLVYLDGNYVNGTYYRTDGWVQMNVSLTLGVHEIEWRLLRDNNDSGGTAWIDDVVFTGQ